MMIGDVSGQSGMGALFLGLSSAKRQYNADFVIINGENAAGGFGITIEDYNNMKKAGGFIQFSMNDRLLDAARSDCYYGDGKDAPEANIAFGWTIKVVNPVWIFFGPGATTKLYYGKYKEDNYPGYEKCEMETINKDKYTSDEEYEEAVLKMKKKTNLAFAISPVILRRF